MRPILPESLSRRHVTPPLAGMAAMLLVACFSRPCDGQVVMAAPAVAAQGGEENAPKSPFTLPAQKSDVAESLAEFHRLSAKGTFERAFKELEKVQAADANALTPAADGLYLPTRLVVRRSLAELSPAGKQAYRLFHDADAKALLDSARGKDELEKLRKVFSDHFVTAVGDTAADRLGDIYFEQGEMAKAADCWQAVLTWRPESAIPRVRLLVKSAIAEARGGHWGAFAAIQREVEQRHAAEMVVVGGKQIVAAEYLDVFAKQHHPPEQTTVAPDEAVPDLLLPPGDAPAWQFRILPPREAAAFAQVGMNWGWNQRFPVTEMVPAVARDEKRVYVNFMGYLMALDVATGKLVWRSARLADLGTKMQQSQFHFPEQYSVVVAGDTLWCVTRDVAQIGQQGQPFRIGRWEAATGKAGWNSQNVGELQQWNFMGQPLVAGDRVYLTAAKNGQGSELYALAVQAADGKQLWSTRLGTHQSDPTQMWHRRSPQPALLLDGGRLYIDTQAGAIVALDASAGAIEWGFAYDSTAPDNNNWYNQPSQFTTAAPPLLAEGTLYVKGMRSDRLYAIDVSAPKLRWKRPVSESSMLAGVDRDTLYLSGDEVLAINLADQKLKWASRLPSGTGWIRPLLTADRFYQFTSRGVFELDKANGDTARLFRGSDLDSLGGMLFTVGDRLLSVSNLAITAYSLDGAERATAAQAAQASATPGGG